MFQDFIQLLSHPQENGIVIFISGILMALWVYHLLLYFQNKDRIYLFYSLYVLVVFIYTYHRANHFLLADLTGKFKPVLVFFYDTIKWVYTSFYILFAITFIDFNKYYPRLYKWMITGIKISFALIFVLSLIAWFSNSNVILNYAYNFFYLPFIFPLSLYILYLVYRSPSPVKYYLLIGAGAYLFISSYSHYLTYTGRPFRVLFYMVTTFEMLLFALGLGHKQKIVLKENDMWQQLIIKELENNLKTKELITEQLGKEVFDKSAQIHLLKSEIKQVEQKKLAAAYSKQILQLRLQAVQAQMNPHFLFNALNSIKNYIIKNDSKQAVVHLTKFAKLIRMVLEAAKMPEVNLTKELELINLYVEVENMRFNNAIDFTIDICPDIDANQIKVPSMIFQSLIENAIWHGLAPKKGDKILKFSVCKKTPYVKFIIEDNGIGREKAALIRQQKNKSMPRESMGIKITQERLAVYTQAYKNKFKMEFIDLKDQEGNPAGTKVLIYIPAED